MPTLTKQAKDVVRGDRILINGVAAKVTDARAHRSYRGYRAIQYEIGERITQADIRSTDTVEMA